MAPALRCWRIPDPNPNPNPNPNPSPNPNPNPNPNPDPSSIPNQVPGARGFDWYFAGEINQYYGNFRPGGPGRVPDFHTADHRNRIDVTADMAEQFIDRNAQEP